MPTINGKASTGVEGTQLLVNIVELARMTSLSTVTLWRLRKRGIIEPIVVGRSVRFDPAQVMTALRSGAAQ